MPSWSDRLEAASTAWKDRLGAKEGPRKSDGDADRARGLAELEHAARELEADLARLLKTLGFETSRAGELEERAMKAIRNADDAAAREALLAHQECIGAFERLQADADVLRASIAECRAVQKQSESSPPKS